MLARARSQTPAVGFPVRQSAPGPSSPSEARAAASGPEAACLHRDLCPAIDAPRRQGAADRWAADTRLASVLSYELDLERRQYRVWGTPDQESRPLLRTPDAGRLLRSISRDQVA